MKKTTRQKLIDATFEEVYSHGYQGASLADILVKAGVHKGSMYHYFGNKKEMALTAIKEKIDVNFLAKLRILLERDNGHLETFLQGMSNTALRDFRRGCPIANLVQEMSNLDEDFSRTMKSIYAEFRLGVKGVLDRAIEVGEMKTCDTQKLALFIASTLEGAILSAKASGEIRDYEDTIEILISYLKQYQVDSGLVQCNL